RGTTQLLTPYRNDHRVLFGLCIGKNTEQPQSGSKNLRSFRGGRHRSAGNIQNKRNYLSKEPEKPGKGREIPDPVFRIAFKSESVFGNWLSNSETRSVQPSTDCLKDHRPHHPT